MLGIVVPVLTSAMNPKALRLAKENVPIVPNELRNLDQRARAVLALFAGKSRIAVQDAVSVLGLSGRVKAFGNILAIGCQFDANAN